jgi:hypothetical protein
LTDDPDPPRGDFGYFAPVYDMDFRLRVRADYEAPLLTLREICLKYRIAASTIQQWARAEGWTMRQPHRVDPNDLVGRMLALLDGQIAELETAMTNGATEVAMLSKLVTTLDRVLALKVHAERFESQPSKKVQTLRSKIADRLAELNRA